MEQDIKAYPPYRNALEEVLRITEECGYGELFTHIQLKEWMDMEEPTTIDEYKKHEFEYLSNIEKMKDELLIENNMFFGNEIGKGYRVLQPDEQVDTGVARHTRKAQKELVKATRALTYVNDSLLSVASEQLRMRKMQRVAFVRAAFRKKNIDVIGGKKKTITETT